MKIMSLYQAIWEIRQEDPRTDLNVSMLMTLIKEKKLPYGNHGNRVVIEMRMLISILNEMLNLTGETFIPKIRTVRNAAVEIRHSDEYAGMGEEHIRRCISDGKLQTIKIGNRYYVAMQSFMYPYSKKLIYGKVVRLDTEDMIRNDMQNQMRDLIYSKGEIPPVVRRRDKK